MMVETRSPFIFALAANVLLFVAQIPFSRGQCSPEGLYPNGNDNTCATYYQCVNGNFELGKCPYGQLFYPEISMCVDKSAYTCGVPVLCGDFDRNVPVPNDCRKYYICLNEYGIKRSCSVNRVFNQKSGFCEYGINCPNEKAFSCPINNGNYPDTSDNTCINYYECQNGRASKRQCPSGYKFHPYPTVRRCLLADSVDCNDANPFVCPSANADFADPRTCTRFYSCQNSAPLHRTCPQGQIFVEKVKRCTDGDQNTCVAGPPFQCPQNSGSFADVNDATCKNYFECTNGVANRVQCPNNFRFHPYPTMRRCLLPDSVDCNDPNPFVCPSANEDVPDPKDCSRFYSCQNYAPLHRSCPTGQIFKDAFKRCETGNAALC